MAQMTIGVDVAPIKSCIDEFKVLIEEQQAKSEITHKEFEELKEMVLDMFNVLSYITEHWER